jgi:membrane protease YdiL (CAAX protease family)
MVTVMLTRAPLSSVGVLFVAVIFCYNETLASLSPIQIIWLALLLTGLIEGLLPRDTDAPRLSTSIALLFCFRLLQPALGALLLDEVSLTSSAAGALSYLIAALALLAFAWSALRRDSWRKKLPWHSALWLGLLGGALSSLLLFFFLWGVPTQTEVITPPDLYWLLGLFWVAAPLWEELCFRGLLFRSLHDLSRQKIWLSALVSATVFALMHEGALLPPLFALGIISALSYIRTQTLLAPISVHLIHNITAWYLGAF